jgi:hypothetical protein
MIGQYLSNKNESVTVAKFEIFSELNKAIVIVFLPLLQYPDSSFLALFTSQKNLQNFSDSASHRIFRRMHGVLNIDENKN